MKKYILSLLVLMITLSLTTLASAKDYSQEKKFKRGLINILTSPMEIPKQIYLEQESAKEKPERKGRALMHFFTGLVKGGAYTVGRIGSGAWDIVTFNVAVPKNYEPLMKPNYVYDKNHE